MAQQTLSTIISIGGNVDNTFGRLGGALVGLGSEIDKLSRKLIDFGKESVEMYADYDDDLRAIQGKIGDISEVEMSELDDQMRDWAEITRYHATDLSSAVKEAATSGWKLAEIYEGIPNVMNLAAAADMSLVDAMEFLNSALAGQGIELENSREFIDQWVMTANNSRATVEDLGESMETLGSLATFTDSSEELFTMLGIMAEYGTKGSEAGTLLRNVILRMVAPTNKAAAALQLLGASEEELAEIESADLGAAAEQIENLGLSAFDQSGNLRSTIEIISDLREAVSGMTEQDMYDVLYDIFPTRTIRGIMDLLRSTDEDYAAMMKTITDSEGYAQEVADLQEGGIGGALREFESRWEELQLTVGETLAPAVEQVADGLGSIVSSISDMDEDTLNGIVSALTIVAGAGPGLLLAGSALRILGYLITPAGYVGAGLVTLAAMAAYMEQIRDADMSANFGTLEVDIDTLQPYITSLGDDFVAAYGDINEFSSSVDTAVESYKTASTEFSSNLLSAMLTQTMLTETDKTNLQNLGLEMYGQLQEGITNATAGSMSYMELLFGGEDNAECDPVYQDIIDLTNQSYLNALSSAEGLSQNLRNAMTSAFDDGTITPEEYGNILGIVDSINQAMAEAANKENYIELQTLLHKAQTVSLDSLKDIAQDINDERDRVLAEEDEHFQKEYFGLEYDYDKAIVNGWSINGETATDEGKSEALAVVQQRHNQRTQTQSAEYDGVLMRAWESGIEQSDLAGVWGDLGKYAEMYLGGTITGEGAVGSMKNLYGENVLAGDWGWGGNSSERYQMGEYMARVLASFGGSEGVSGKMDYYTSIGDTENASAMARLYTMEQIINGFSETGVTSDTPFGWFDGDVYSSSQGDYATGSENQSSFEGTIAPYLAEYTTEIAKATTAAFSGENGHMDAMWASIGAGMKAENIRGIEAARSDMDGAEYNEYIALIDKLTKSYDFDKILANESNVLAQDGSAYRDEVAAYSLLYGDASQNPESYRITAEVIPEINESAIQEAASDLTITAEVIPDEGQNTQLDAIVQLDPAADATQYTSVFDANVSPTANIMAENPVTDATEYSSIFTSNANPSADVSTNSASAAGSAWASAFSANCSPSVRIRTSGGGSGTASTTSMMKYADGGRSDVPAIFGEAGAEWAIPEEHSVKTAALLNSAREASGFTWPELIARTGGLNATPRLAPRQLIYAPQVHANDATGVEEVLKNDKKQLDDWWESKALKEGRETYE